MSAPTHAVPATPEILSKVLQKELVMFSNSYVGYLDPSNPSMITAADRMALVDWCYHVVDNCHHHRETVAMAMMMVDAFLSTPSSTADVARASDEALYSQHKFQLLTIAALYCAIKAKSNIAVPSDMHMFVHDVCGSLYTKEEIETVERTLLSDSSSWRCAPAAPTAYEVGRTVLSFLVPYTNLPEATRRFLLDEMKYQTEHAVRGYYFSTQRTSTIALAAIFNSVNLLSSNAHQDMLGKALDAVVERFDFDDSKLIFVARQRLLSLTNGENPHPQNGLNLDHSTKSLLLDQSMSIKSIDLSVSMRSLDLTDVEFDELMNSFEIECDRTIPVPTKDDATSKAATQQSDAVAARPPLLPLTPVTPIRPAVDIAMPKKPLRPLTAYQTYLQIEREYIIQTMDGEDSDKSLHDDKVYLDYVPERYRQIKLSPEWYFGPGKRSKKRKHRKGHGKVGFLELSRMISSRWAKLDETHPDIKRFVQKIADQELAEYRRDMAAYKRYIKNNGLITPSDQLSREDSPVLENDLKGFAYHPARKLR
jgi:hypothetical protein